MKNTLLRTLALSAFAIAFIAFTLLLPSCAAIQKRTIDPNSWIQLDKSELTFTEKMPEGGAIFAKVIHLEEATNVFILAAMNPDFVSTASIIDEEGDGIVDSAFIGQGTYNDKVALDGFPITAQSYPRSVDRRFYDKVTQDLNTILKAWKTKKHISLLEMNAIVMALATPENEMVAHYPILPDNSL